MSNIDITKLKTAEMKAAEAAAQQARAAERAAQRDLKLNIKMDEVFDQLRAATPAQINTFVNNAFSGMTAQQRKVIKMLVQVAAITVRGLPDDA